MLQRLQNIFRRKKRRYAPLDPDEIFLDSQNLPDFNKDQFEGRIERPISKSVFGLVGFFIVAVGLTFVWKVWQLQIVSGEAFAAKSANNSLHTTLIFADRGLILDRTGTPLAWNEINMSTTTDFSLRAYATSTGFSTTIGYIKYPSKDSSGFYISDTFSPKDGLEKIYNSELTGTEGKKIEETDAHGDVVSESVIEPPKDGKNLTLSIDARLQKKLYESMLDIANRAGYRGGAGVIMDVHTGEIVASANFPEYESQTMTDGTDTHTIASWISNADHPFLNRVIHGIYTPGSIVKPYVAMGVLDQKVIDPNQTILSTGSISVPNPYDPANPTIFKDWKAHGYVDLRHALAVSSDVYFYEVSGGYNYFGINQKGIGIDNVEKYVRMFGFGTTTGIDFPGEQDGVIPDPAWKAAHFDGEDWRLGDTYHTAIGQYGFQVTPIQAVRAVAAIANGGTLYTPTFLLNQKPQPATHISLDPSYYTIVREGMRLSVTEGTSLPLNEAFVQVAAKTGTAQLGALKAEVNSWVEGFWPYDWMGLYAQEYLK